MNTLKFLAHAIAVQAAEICNMADHIADNHTSTMPESEEDISACGEQLSHDTVKLAALMELAQLNKLVPRVTPPVILQLRRECHAEVKREMLKGMMTRRIDGGLSFPAG
jgi:hypothetical protein